MSTHRAPTRAAVRVFSRVVIATTASAALALGLASTASAAPAPTSFVPAGKVASPNSCLKLDWSDSGFAWRYQSIKATNFCGYTVGFRVVNGGPVSSERSPCIAVAPRATAGWKWTKGRKYRGAENCKP